MRSTQPASRSHHDKSWLHLAWSTLLVCSILLAVRANEQWTEADSVWSEMKDDSESTRELAMEKPKSEIHAQCTQCKKQFKFVVPKEAHQKWRSGVLVQDALPMLTPGERELLISGTCEPCFDEMFAEDAAAEADQEMIGDDAAVLEDVGDK